MEEIKQDPTLPPEASKVFQEYVEQKMRDQIDPETYFPSLGYLS